MSSLQRVQCLLCEMFLCLTSSMKDEYILSGGFCQTEYYSELRYGFVKVLSAREAATIKHLVSWTNLLLSICHSRFT
jgi:hypothetical protein